MQSWQRFWNDSAGVGGTGGRGGGCFGGVGIVEAGQAVGDDLSCGFSGCFGVGELLCGSSLGFGGGGSYSEIMLGYRR